jgi:hypothetical protein
MFCVAHAQCQNDVKFYVGVYDNVGVVGIVGRSAQRRRVRQRANLVSIATIRCNSSFAVPLEDL